jgi:hypothetical protein
MPPTQSPSVLAEQACLELPRRWFFREAAPGLAQKVMQFSGDIWVLVSAGALLRARRSGA